jgi:hypothetical protein
MKALEGKKETTLEAYVAPRLMTLEAILGREEAQKIVQKYAIKLTDEEDFILAKIQNFYKEDVKRLQDNLWPLLGKLMQMPKDETLTQEQHNSLHNFQIKIMVCTDDFIKKIEESSDNPLNAVLAYATEAVKYNKAVQEAINCVTHELQKDLGVWDKLNPIIKGILGVLAALTILPAIIVQTTTKQGFAGTFFTTPETEKTKTFKGHMDDFGNTDVSPGSR